MSFPAKKPRNYCQQRLHTVAGVHEGELEIEYSTGEIIYSQLTGTARDVDVSLSTSSLKLTPTYVSNLSQATFKVFNRSNTAVKFRWKRCQTSEEEFASATSKLLELGRETSCQPIERYQPSESDAASTGGKD